LHAFTHSVVWASVLAAAVVAAVVTLLVEYLAKPGLEARKDRIIEYSREQRAAVRDISRGAYLAMRLCDYYIITKNIATATEAADYINEEALKTAREIEELIANARPVVYVPTWMTEEWNECIDRVLAFAITLRLAPHLPGYYVWSKPGDDMWATFRTAAIRLYNLIVWQGMSNWHLSLDPPRELV
jgi:hypothetical protein